ncbi:hypothetical protein ACFQH5_20050 [Halomonas salifodinae]|uniref:Uncharacterized protein n=1 Tax=Halomonas salifodinae TaxID=438745 RepID=A0ABW2F5L3_9GAMM
MQNDHRSTAPFSGVIAAFVVLMASVSLFTYVQIEGNAHQSRRQRLARARDAQGQQTS